MRIFNIAIIGYGGFGQFLHHHWNMLPNVRVAAVADPNIQAPAAVLSFADWRELLRQPDLDLIAIATTPDTHAAIAVECMRAGKHVLIEKPIATTLADAQMLLDTRDQNGKVAGVDFIMRFNPLLQAIQALTQQGVFGKLRRVAVENFAQDEGLPPKHWFWDKEKSGGILVEHAVHFIDLVHFLWPAITVSVNGLKCDRNARQEDQIMANVAYEGGLIATHYHAFARPGFFEVTKIKLAYDLADLELEGWIPLGGTLSALVNAHTKQALLDCPFFEKTNIIPIEQAADESRPKGWGQAENPDQAPDRAIRSGGEAYEVSEIMTGKFQIGKSKSDVYAQCVQDSLLDVLHKIADPTHPQSAPLETGLSSLDIALRATASARAANP